MDKKSLEKRVFNTCDQFTKDGKQITVNGVIALTGGKRSTVNELINDYYTQHKRKVHELSINLVKKDIAETLAEFIVYETHKQKLFLQGDLDDAIQLYNDLQQDFKEVEQKSEQINTLTKDITLIQENFKKELEQQELRF